MLNQSSMLLFAKVDVAFSGQRASVQAAFARLDLQFRARMADNQKVQSEP